MPKWLADFSEKTFKAAYKQTVITEVEYYARVQGYRYRIPALNPDVLEQRKRIYRCLVLPSLQRPRKLPGIRIESK